MTVRRYDTCEFSSPVRRDNGYLSCDAHITRTGVFGYRLANGTIRRELRLPDEVFNADSLATFKDIPLTNNHPPAKLTSKNTRQFQIGLVNDARRDKARMAAKVMITDEGSIGDAEAGKSEMSCGYYCDLDMTGGTTSGIEGIEDGLKFDAIQRNIRGNHVALVSKGRAGVDAALHLDADDAVMVEDGDDVRSPFNSGSPRATNQGQRRNTMNYRLDGVDFDVDQQFAQALDKKFEKLDADVASIREGTSKEKARADEAEEKLKTLGEERSDEAIAKMVKARAALQTKAAAILTTDDGSADPKLDGMTEDELKKAIVVKLQPAAKDKMDGADAVYVQARYDAAIEAWDEQAKNDATDATRKGNNGVGGAGGGGGERHDAAKARAKMIADTINRGREAIPNQPSTAQG